MKVVILSTADFAADVWTNKQHLAVGLASRGVEVVYVESFGLRTPRLAPSDVSRISKRIIGRLVARATAQPEQSVRTGNVTIVSPIIIPFHGSRAIRAINRVLVKRLIRKLPNDAVLWTFHPMTYGIESGHDTVVYHSIDLLHHQQRLPAEALITAEKSLVERADVLIASSRGVQEHVASLSNRRPLLWENVADTALYGSVRSARENTVIFAGNLTPSKIDIDIMRRIADARVRLVLAGPIGVDGTDVPKDFASLLAHPFVTYCGNLAPSRLAEEFARAKVGIIPYILNDYTSGVFPMKVYEYMAAGLEVVSTPLPSLRESPGLRLCTSKEFVASVIEALSAFDEVSASERSRVADEHSWHRRIDQALELLRGLEDYEEPIDSPCPS